MTKHTPGPWAWFGGETNFYLGTEHSGRRYVMKFRRRGMNEAQPTFQIDGRMLPAEDLAMFAVGDRSVRGFKEARKDGSVYRYDVVGFDHPDARLIAAAPVLLNALKAARAYVLDAVNDDGGIECCEIGMRIDLERIDIAIASAEGQS